MKRTAVLLVPLALALAACGGGESSASSSSSAGAATPAAPSASSAPIAVASSAPKAEPDEFLVIDALHLAFEEAGGVCDDFLVDEEPATDSVKSGRCDGGDGDVFMLFDSHVDARTKAIYLKEAHERIGIEGAFLLGANWLINTDQAEAVKERLGGEVITTDPAAIEAANSTTVLEDAVSDCGVEGNEFFDVGDEGYSLNIDGKPDKKKRGAKLADTICVLFAIEVPDSVIGRMENTTSLQGVQEAEWDTFTVRWTYHPDNGFDVIIEDAG